MVQPEKRFLDERIKKVQECRFGTDDIWLCILNKRERLSWDDIQKILEEFCKRKEATIAELYKQVFEEEVKDVFLESVSFHPSAKINPEPEEVSKDLNRLCRIMAARLVTEITNEGDVKEYFEKTLFGEKCENAIHIVFKKKIKPILGNDRLLLGGEPFTLPQIASARE
jgi:hypothetical protein